MDIYLEYLRKSREDIEYEKNNENYQTLERHKERLKLITENSGKHVFEENIYREVVSGDSISERPEIQKLLINIEDPKIKGVWVIDVQRLCRGDLGDQDKIIKTFKYTNTLILTPEKEYNLQNPADEEYLIDKLSYSRKEYNNIKKRLSEGRKDSVREGKFIGSRPAYGYERIKLKGQKGYTLQIVPEQAEVVRLIFKFCLENRGTFSTASYLNNLGIKSPGESEWTKNQVREMLHNKTYAGYVKWQERKHITVVENGNLRKKCIRQKKGDYLLIKGKHDPIISEDDFNLVQEKLKNASEKYVKEVDELQNPLAGILRCKKCNLAMARGLNQGYYYTPRGDKNGVKHFYNIKEYVKCTNSKKCRTVTNNLDQVENMIIEQLIIWLKENKKMLSNYDRNESTLLNSISNELSILEKEIEKENNKLSRIRSFLEDGTYDKDTYVTRATPVINNIEKLTQSKNKIIENNESLKIEKIRLIIPKVENCIKNYFNLSVQDKNNMLHSILEKVLYSKTKTRFESDLTLDIFLKI